jgi:membrane protease YdiL (CAAX protease family)
VLAMLEADTRREAAFDVALVLATISVAWAVSRFWLYPALGVPNNAPLILRPISGFLMAAWLVRRRGQGFAAYGFTRPPSIVRALLAALLLYGALTAVSRWLVPPLAAWLGTSDQPSFILYIRGRLAPTLLWVAIGWLVGGFSEELLFRGFLQRRVADLCGGRQVGHGLGVLSQALLFGSLHWYAGAFAFVHAAVFATVFGIAYFAAGRNLWPLILVHGIWNTIGVWGVYTQ